MRKTICILIGITFFVCLGIFLFFLPTLINYIELLPTLSQVETKWLPQLLPIIILFFSLSFLLICNLILNLSAFIIQIKSQKIKNSVGILNIISTAFALFLFSLWFTETFQALWTGHIDILSLNKNFCTAIYITSCIALVVLGLILSTLYLQSIIKKTSGPTEARQQKKIDKLDKQIEKLNQQREKLNKD